MAKSRKEAILQFLRDSQTPVTGVALAKEFHVSRQVIVNDIALLRAQGETIVSTNKGYIVPKEKKTYTRVFKNRHYNDQARQEYQIIVDRGGVVKDIFIYHHTYGIMRAELNLKSRHDIDVYLDNFSKGNSSPLENITDGYHYHTVEADSEETLDDIQKRLAEAGFLAKLVDFEPVDFWKK